MSINKFNQEGYKDPTAYTALTNVHKTEKTTKAYLPIVYICSPYAGDIVRNVENARRYSRFAYEEGAIPFAPHLLFPQFMDDSNFKERRTAINFNKIMLSKCDELWVFGSRFSSGMSDEICEAERKYMKIRYFTENLEELKNA